MRVFSPVQFQHTPLAHVKGPHDFPDTGGDERYRPYAPNVTEDSFPKEYSSPLIAQSNKYKASVYHGESWDTPESAEFEMPEHATFGHTVRHMAPR